MKINFNIFRSYDIRGIYPQELDEEAAFKIGQGFIKYTKAKNVAIGRDCRISSPSLFIAISKGIIARGANVYDLGPVPTECLYFAVGHYGFDGGIMITASHNPKEYNGFKMVKKGMEWIRGREIGKIIEKTYFKKARRKGKIKKINIWQDYFKHAFSFINIKKIKPFKVVIDTSNGMAGILIEKIEKKLPIKIIPLNFKPDGNFPAHSPNPLEELATKQISQKIIEEKADFGFIFDGDADRIFLIDEIGNLVRGDITLLLLAHYFLKKNPGAKIAYNLICSKAVPQFIEKWGGEPIKTAVGFVNVREGMIKKDGIMGGELSGHYCFKENFYSDSALITFLVLLQLISESGKRVSKMVRKLSPFAKSSEINFGVKGKEKVLNKIKKLYSDGRRDYLDGLSVEYDDWWFNLRPSQTEPILRLTIEAKTKKLLKEKKKELMRLIEIIK